MNKIRYYLLEDMVPLKNRIKRTHLYSFFYIDADDTITLALLLLYVLGMVKLTPS